MTRPTLARTLTLVLGALLLLIPATPHIQAQTPPAIELLSPAAGQQVSGPLDVRVQITALKLDGTRIGTPPQPGVGHWHVYVDGKYAGLSVSGSISVPNDAMPQIAAGPHELKVQLHNNDHTPIQPDVTSAITGNFAAGQPASGGKAASAAAPAAAQVSAASNLPRAGTAGLQHTSRVWPITVLAMFAGGVVALGIAGWLTLRSHPSRSDV